MRLFGKEANRKLKSVTIIHSATTETVRLPEDNNGVSFKHIRDYQYLNLFDIVLLFIYDFCYVVVGFCAHGH